MENGGGGAGFDVEFAIDAGKMMIHRAETDAQNGADLWIPLALTHPLENFIFAARQRV